MTKKKLLKMCMTALLMVVSATAWALNQVGGVYQVGSVEDFVAFSELVNGGEVTANAVLTADIDLGLEEAMIGADKRDFQGTFDGQGHTITVNSFPEEGGKAIFRNVGGRALIKNLIVKGTITTAMSNAAGIAVYSSGRIDNCAVDLVINSSKTGDATHGGIVALAYNGTYITNSIARLTINGVNTTNCGGIVGWSSGRANIQNCLAILDTDMAEKTFSSSLARNSSQTNPFNLEDYLDPEGKAVEGAVYNNYANQAWGDVEKVNIITNEDLASGKIAYLLNHDQGRIVWTQDIGKDPFPTPNPAGKRVYASVATNCQGKAEGEGEVTYSNTDDTGMAATGHTFDDHGVCTTCGYFNIDFLERDPADGFHKMSTQKDFEWAEIVNQTCNGAVLGMKLMNDIEFVTEPGKLIFNTNNYFNGVLDGQGHEMTINFTDAPEAASLFPQLSGTVRNVIFHGSISGGEKYYSTVTGHARGGCYIENVYSDININSTRVDDNTHAGIIGVNEADNKMKNVIYAGKIEAKVEGATNVGGIIGWCGGRMQMDNVAFIGEIINFSGDTYTISRKPQSLGFSNVFYIYESVNQNKGPVQLDPSSVESGELAFRLNRNVNGGENFYQVIGTDPAPMPIMKEGAKVYADAVFRCDGMLESINSFGNSVTEVVLPLHQFDEDGFCTVCGNIDEDLYATDDEGWFNLANGSQLTWWSHYAAKHLDSKARLTADIDMDGYSERYAQIGKEQAPFIGCFDGQHHTISNLVIENLAGIGVGLISVMNSVPAAPLNDDDARNTETPSYVANVTLDNSCSITGHGYVGIVGMTSPWAGSVKFYNLGMEGDVRATEGANAGGVLGCVMASACKVVIDNCFMSGNVYGVSENASFSGWLGSYATVSNCYAVGTVENAQDDEHYFARFGTATLVNCYAKYGTQVPTVTDEEVKNGALAYKANDGSLTKVLWYQNLQGDEIDEHPTPNPAHGVVFQLPDDLDDPEAVKYYSVSNEEELTGLVTVIQERETKYLDNVEAQKDLTDAYEEEIESLSDAVDVAQLGELYTALLKNRAAFEKSAQAYKHFTDAVQEIIDDLAARTDVEGDLLDELNAYLEGSDGPTADWPLGAYLHIIEERMPDEDALTEELARVKEAYKAAVKEGYIVGADVSTLVVNPIFNNQSEGWTGNTGNTGAKSMEVGGKTWYGAERYNGSLHMYQTITGLKPGKYLVTINAAYRPSNNRYGYNHIATISANENTTYVMTAREGMIGVDDAEDNVNAHITGGTPDHPIFEDGVTTDTNLAQENGIALIGYTPHRQYSMAIAAASDRLLHYVVGTVGEDSTLTITLDNPTSKYAEDWFGFANLRLQYCGDETTEATQNAYQLMMDGMLARANSELNDYVVQDINVGYGPNYAADLKSQLTAAVMAGETATTVEAQTAAAQSFSTLFPEIAACKLAYFKLYNTANTLQDAAGIAIEVLGDDYNAVLTATDVVMGEKYFDGVYSKEEAMDPVDFQIPEVTQFLPEMEADTFLISKPLQMAYFKAYVENVNGGQTAYLTADIDMSVLPQFLPIGNGGSAYTGIFDGQTHALNNLDIAATGEGCGLFHTLSGTVKNLKLRGNMASEFKYMGPVTGIFNNGLIDNVDAMMTMTSSVVGDGTHGGIVGLVNGGVISNCIVRNTMIGDQTNSCGGFVGWANQSMTIKNSLMLSDIQVSPEGSNTISRNPGNATISNCFYLKGFGDLAGTQATNDQLKSGFVTYKLNESKSDMPKWFQTIGTDTIPQLFSGSIVYYSGGDYQNEVPVIELNAFAYNIYTSSTENDATVNFTLNAPIASGEVRFYDGATLAHTEPLTSANLTAGAHAVTVPNTALPVAGTKLTVEVKVTGIGTLDGKQIGESKKFNSTRGVAVNNAPESAGFGNIYVLESYSNSEKVWGVGTGKTGYESDEKNAGLYAFTPDLKTILASDGTPGFKGGLIYKDGIVINEDNKLYDLKNVRVSQDGRLFIGRASGISNSPIVEVDQTDLNKDWMPVFTGGELDEATGITYVGAEEQSRPVCSFDVEGKGADLKLWVLGGARSDGEFKSTDFQTATYALGAAKTFTGAATVFDPLTGVYTITGGPVQLISDQRGGVWYMQHRAAPTAIFPALKHFNAEGAEDYSDITTVFEQGAMAVSKDGSIVALGTKGNVAVYTCDYVPLANGKIFLTPLTVFRTVEDKLTGMAFDYANNLYVASYSSDTFTRYTVPYTDKDVVTPGNAESAFNVGQIKDAIEQVEAENGTGRIYNLQGVQLRQVQKGVNIVNGKKVLVK